MTTFSNTTVRRYGIIAFTQPERKEKKMHTASSRRQFLKTATAAAGFAIVPARVLWGATEKQSREELDRAIALVKEVLAK